MHDNPYLQRINLVLDHIRTHPADDLSLDALANIAGFSPFHFHRIFKTLTGETLNQCTTRLRLERAAALLKTAPQMPIMDAALECGFESASVFSRTFKKRYGFSPRQWDRQTPLKDRKNGQVLDGFPHYTIENLSEFDEHGAFEVRLRELPETRLAYLRVDNSYQPNRVIDGYKRLIAWVQAQGGDLRLALVMGMSQDDPDITPLELCRYDWCVAAPDDWEVSGEISQRIFPACCIATIHCHGDIYTVDRAWQYLYRYWLPHSRFQPANLPAMEIYRRQPAEIGWQQYDLECAVPVVSL